MEPREWNVVVGQCDGNNREFFFAKCEELGVTGFGRSEEDAIENCKSKMRLALEPLPEPKTIKVTL